MARTPQSTLTCTMRSSEHAAHRLLMHMCSHIALLAQGLALCVLPYHPCMRTCVLFLEYPSLYFFLQFLFQLYLMSISAPDEISIEDPLFNSSLGEHGHYGLCHTPHMMEKRTETRSFYADFSGDRGVHRNVRSGCRQHSRITKSEASTFFKIEFVFEFLSSCFVRLFFRF